MCLSQIKATQWDHTPTPALGGEMEGHQDLHVMGMNTESLIECGTATAVRFCETVGVLCCKLS